MLLFFFLFLFFLSPNMGFQDQIASPTARPEEHEKPFPFPCIHFYSQNGLAPLTDFLLHLGECSVRKGISRAGTPAPSRTFQLCEQTTTGTKKALTPSEAFKGSLVIWTRLDQARPDKRNSHKGPGSWTLTCSSRLNSVTMNSIVVKQLLAGWG